MKQEFVLLGGGIVALAVLFGRSKGEETVPDLGSFWGGGSSTVTTTTEETPAAPAPSVVFPEIAPFTPTAYSFSVPATPETAAPAPKKSATPAPTPRTFATPNPSPPIAGGNAGFGGGGVGGRKDEEGGGFLSGIIPALGALLVGGPALAFPVLAGGAAMAMSGTGFGGVTSPAAPTSTPTAAPAPAASKKSAIIGGETFTDSAGNFTGAFTYPDYSRGSVGNDTALYVPYTVTDHTGDVHNQVIREGAGGKKHAMSVDSARILSSDRPEAVAWRARYGDTSSTKKSSSVSSTKKSSSVSSTKKSSSVSSIVEKSNPTHNWRH